MTAEAKLKAEQLESLRDSVVEFVDLLGEDLHLHRWQRQILDALARGRKVVLVGTRRRT